jgi:ubiquinone/menaquinone biosynthesis C-methylase UbiE
MNLEIIDTYNKDAKRYDTKWKEYLRDSLERPVKDCFNWLEKHCSQSGPTITILDVGCGTGEFVYRLLQKVKDSNVQVDRIQFVGVEPATEMLSIAMEKCNEMLKSFKNYKDIVWENCSALHLPLPDSSVSVLVSTNMLHFVGNMDDIKLACNEFGRVLKKENPAILLLTDWCYDFWSIQTICWYTRTSGYYKSSNALTAVEIKDLLSNVKDLGECKHFESFKISALWGLWYCVY